METGTASGVLSLVPFAIMSLAITVIAHLLAREKGRHIAVWTILGFIPLVNFVCIWYFVGAANLRLESKARPHTCVPEQGNINGRTHPVMLSVRHHRRPGPQAS